MSDVFLYVPSEVHITTYRYFFAQELKKPLHALADRPSHIVIYPFDGTYNHLTYFGKKMAELRNSKQILEFGNRKCCLPTWLYFVEIFSLIAVFSFFSKDVSFL